MDEKTLFKVSLIITLIGILILLAVSESIEVNESKISLISKKDIDKAVRLKGKITYIKETPGLFIFNLEDSSGKIKVIAFKQESFQLEKNSIVEIEGVVKEYNNELEVQADRIKVF